jgi:hypothetical protein
MSERIIFGASSRLLAPRLDQLVVVRKADHKDRVDGAPG